MSHKQERGGGLLDLLLCLLYMKTGSLGNRSLNIVKAGEITQQKTGWFSNWV